MRRTLIAALLAMVPLGAAGAGMGFLKGNDTGGIIAWSPENQRYARGIAGEHCAQFGKVARITSVWPRYGQYIGFACQFPRSYYVRHQRRGRVVLRVRY